MSRTKFVLGIVILLLMLTACSEDPVVYQPAEPPVEEQNEVSAYTDEDVDEYVAEVDEDYYDIPVHSSPPSISMSSDWVMGGIGVPSGLTDDELDFIFGVDLSPFPVLCPLTSMWDYRDRVWSEFDPENPEIAEEDAISYALRGMSPGYADGDTVFSPELLGLVQPFEYHDEIWAWRIDMQPCWITDEHFPMIYYVCARSGQAVPDWATSLLLSHPW